LEWRHSLCTVRAPSVVFLLSPLMPPHLLCISPLSSLLSPLSSLLIFQTSPRLTPPNGS
jgi:hypothetical protein